MDQTISDIIPELIPFLPEWIRPDTIRYRSLYILLRDGPDLIQPDTGAYALSSDVEPIPSDPIPKLVHPLPGWIRSYAIRYQSLHTFFRNGSHPIRSDTGAYTSFSGMDPTPFDQIPERIHYFTMWNRSHPIRYLGLWISFRIGPDPMVFIGLDKIIIKVFPDLVRSAWAMIWQLYESGTTN
jgi:hypothetical protein